MLREYCAENLKGVPEALAAGAQRIELCDDLSVGGITPCDEVIARAVQVVHAAGGAVMVMVRPRGGDFAYNEAELGAMERTIGVARAAGADGVVFGCVRNGMLDRVATARLATAAQGMDMTFHMAFDQVDRAYQPAVLGELVELGFSRVLTHGGALTEPVERCLPWLHELVRAADKRIAIMPGGGITWHNAEQICTELGVTQVHGTKIVRL